MIKKILALILMLNFCFFTDIAYAYNLPKIKIEKKVSKKNKVDDDNIPKMKSDWTNFEIFDAKIKKMLKNGSIPANSSERVTADKNIIFVAYYRDNAYFLDKYSITINQDSPDRKSWSQRIFASGSGVTAKNAQAVLQKFSFIEKNKYNSFKKKNLLDEVENIEDKEFLNECFRVGYYYAFDEVL